MNILFAYYDPEIQIEIEESLNLTDSKTFFSINAEETIRMLNTQAIELVVLRINNLRDASILKYIDDYYTGLEVLIMVSSVFIERKIIEYDGIISAFILGHFTLIKQPVNLAERKKELQILLNSRVSIRNSNSILPIQVIRQQ